MPSDNVEDQIEDCQDLPDLYNRELLRKKTNPLSNNSNDNEGEGGGYKEWKERNGMSTSDGMVSSLGRALHNQGIISQDNDFYDRNHIHEIHSNSMPSSDFYRKEHQKMRLNASEPCHPHKQHRGRQNSQENEYRNDEQPYLTGDIRPQNVRHYSYAGRDINGAEFVSNEISNGCVGQCCTSQTISPRNHQRTTNHRDHIDNRSSNHHSNMQEYHGHGNEVIQNHNYAMTHSPPYRVPNHCKPQLSVSCPQYHQPSSCACCHNQNENPHRSHSPHKKCSTNKKTDASVKKLYRILWLQNEQLGLLEKQVSKLIEMNCTKESIEKCDKSNSVEESISESQVSGTNKVKTCEVGVMVNLPCISCQTKENKQSSSESDQEINPKQIVEESLTLHGVDIPVNREEMTSPPASMHIDMQEFQESSTTETEESDTSEDGSEPVGWTFYDNVVGQVNNILKSAKKKKSKKKHAFNDEMNFALEQLKRLKMHAPESETNNAKRVTFEHGVRDQQSNLRAQSEISMNFNAIASKYLTSAGGKAQDISMCNVISSNTNMSMATMRYLERHQISNRDCMDVLSIKTPGMKSRKNRSTGEKAISKFLDVTAIRQQPKLLPKDSLN